MRPMTDAEVLAAIDRGMRRVWARFPDDRAAPREGEKAMTAQPSDAATPKRSPKSASARRSNA